MALRRARGAVPGSWSAPLALVVAALAWAPARADVLYRETFGNAAAADPLLSTADWAAHSGDTGTYRPGGGNDQANINATSGRMLPSPSGPIIAANSNPYDLLNVNAGEPTAFLFDTDGDGTNDSNPRGLVYINGTPWGTTAVARRALVWTPEYSLVPSDYVNGTLLFRWNQGDGNAADQLSPAVRVGSQWYVANERFTTSATALVDFWTVSVPKQFTFTRDAAAWSTLNFNGTFDAATDVGADSTAGMSIGTPLTADLPAGTINAFGIFSLDPNTPFGNRRFDTFTIEGTPIPEPASASVVAIGCGLLLARRRARLTTTAGK
jgi:hypothetical protein